MTDKESKDFEPWQLWFMKHVHCGGEFKMQHGKLGSAMVCTCLDVEKEKPPKSKHSTIQGQRIKLFVLDEAHKVDDLSTFVKDLRKE